MATMRQPLSFDGVHNFLDTLFGDDLHAKRVKSLAGATLGAIQSASLAVGLIGQGLALARGRRTKHAVKQVDRLLSNQGIDVDALLGHWVARRPIGLAPVVAREHCAARRLPPRRIRSPPWSACGRRA